MSSSTVDMLLQVFPGNADTIGRLQEGIQNHPNPEDAVRGFLSAELSEDLPDDIRAHYQTYYSKLNSNKP